MAWPLDARIPVTFGRIPNGRPFAALLLDGAHAPTNAVASQSVEIENAHPGGCACCAARPAAALALDRLFQARVRGAVPWFVEVVALATDSAGRARIVAALRADPLTAARFRPGD